MPQAAVMTGAIGLRLIVFVVNPAQLWHFSCLSCVSSPSPVNSPCVLSLALLFLSSLSLFFFPPSSFSFPLICRTHFKETNSCSSEMREYIGRNVCPSWHYNALYQLTREVGGEQGGREEDVEMLRTFWEQDGGKKRELFVAAYLTGYEATQWLWHLAK